MKKTFETSQGIVKVRDCMVEHEAGVNVILEKVLVADITGITVAEINNENIEPLIYNLINI